MEQQASTSEKEERDNLGWLASSTMPARKRRHIEGAGAARLTQQTACSYITAVRARYVSTCNAYMIAAEHAALGCVQVSAPQASLSCRRSCIGLKSMPSCVLMGW